MQRAWRRPGCPAGCWVPGRRSRSVSRGLRWVAQSESLSRRSRRCSVPAHPLARCLTPRLGLHGCNGRASVTGTNKLLRCSPTRYRECPPAPAAGRPLSERTCRTQRPAPWGRWLWAGMVVGRLRGEPIGNGGWSSTRSPLRSRAIASIGYLAGHADLARYLALVVNELLTVSACRPLAAQPSKGHLTFITEAV